MFYLAIFGMSAGSMSTESMGRRHRVKNLSRRQAERDATPIKGE